MQGHHALSLQHFDYTDYRSLWHRLIHRWICETRLVPLFLQQQKNLNILNIF